MPPRPQNGPQAGSQNGFQGGFQNGFQAGQPSGGQTQTAPAQPDPLQRATNLSAWIDEVVAAGGVTADSADITRLQAASDHLAEVIAAGGTELGADQERLIGSIARDLRRVSQVGDSTVGSGEGEYGTVLGFAEYRLEEFLEAQGALLSSDATALLTDALETLETVYADGVVTDAERTDIGSAADAVCSVLKDDFTKLSDAGLAALQDQQDDLTTLIDTGFLGLDADQWTAINSADAALDALLAGGGDTERAAAHEAVDSLRLVVAGSILELASPVGMTGGRGGYGGADSGLLVL